MQRQAELVPEFHAVIIKGKGRCQPTVIQPKIRRKFQHLSSEWIRTLQTRLVEKSTRRRTALTKGLLDFHTERLHSKRKPELMKEVHSLHSKTVRNMQTTTILSVNCT